ncbi:hypothetical protein CRG86_010135 [Photobacterium leiognathi]|nr:hypothetical protein CRG86_010135 [Photobacterium leiognathi]
MSIIKYIGSSASSAIIKGGVQLTQIVILARVCSVEDLGVLAIANVLLGFSILFSEMGLSQAIIYEKN